MTPATNPRARQIELLKQRDGARCWICLETEDAIFQRGDRLTRDHLIPRARGGPDHLRNLKLACSRCNELRGCRAAHRIIPGKLPGKRNRRRYDPGHNEFDYQPAKKSATKKELRAALRAKLPKPSYRLADVARGSEVLLAVARKVSRLDYLERYSRAVGRLGD